MRLWLTGTLGELAENLQKHHNDLRIVRQWENEPKVPTIFQLLSETARQTARDADGIPPLLAGALIRAILSGAKYPESLYTAVLRRVHMERSVNYLKAAVIKAVLVRNHQQSINAMLDNECEIPAYRLGRLFAVLEKIQEEGHREQTGRNCEKTIRETYFSTACSTPAAVFPRIQQLSTHHRRHLNPGRKVQFDKLIADINWQLNPQSGAPKSHNLEEQGLFILGYYHQRKSLFSKAEAESETVSTEA